jgi:hypothetical protein
MLSHAIGKSYGFLSNSQVSWLPAFAFHRTAYKERLDEVKDSLKVIEKLRDYKPKPSGRHKTSGSHTPMFGAFTGLMTPFTEKDHFNLLSSRLRSEGSQPSDGEDADVEDRAKAKKRKGKGKGKRKQRDSKTFVALEESTTNTPEYTGSSVTTPATHSPADKHTTHKYPPTPVRQRSVDDDPTIVVQAAKAFKSAVLHDARNIKGTVDEQEGLGFSVGSTHEAKVRPFGSVMSIKHLTWTPASCKGDIQDFQRSPTYLSCSFGLIPRIRYARRSQRSFPRFRQGQQR